MKLAMEFTCRGDGQPPSAKIRGYDTTIRSLGTAEPPDEEFDFPTTDATVEAGKLIVSETGLVAPGSSAAKLLPNVIAKLNSYPHFECHLPDDGDEWTNVGGSSNVVYVRLEQPIDGPLCETLLEIGCVAASGKSSRLGAYWPIRDKFASLNITRIDSVRLTYYDPADLHFRRSDEDGIASPLHAKTTTILTDSGYGGIVLANCVGFSDLFIHCLLAQGIGQVRMLRVYSAGPAIPAYPNGEKGLLVANWTWLIRRCWEVARRGLR